ncbi:MAG: hypothetical protein GY878_06995 [Fuerstiella sp.]|nr:hypothetical protein [Fuerstiella sp.]
MTWLASGNNVILEADTARRVCHIRLQSPLENPEDRDGFKHPDIRKHVRANRARLLCAALTILRSYIAAGRPDQKLKPWGSFEDWSDLVRSAVVYAGLPDPGETRDDLRDTSDSEAGALQQMMEAVRNVDEDGLGLRTSDLLRICKGKDSSYGPNEVQMLADAVEMLCGRSIDKITAGSLGNKLGHFRNRVIDGVQLDCKKRKGTNYWFAESLRGGPVVPGGPISADLNTRKFTNEEHEEPSIKGCLEPGQKRSPGSTRSTPDDPDRESPSTPGDTTWIDDVF